jgi:4'-phosphopantetheinyl transferase
VSGALTVLVLWCRGADRGLAQQLIRAGARDGFGLDDPSMRVVNHCARCGSTRHGRPLLTPATAPAIHVSISRCGDATVVALTEAGPVGVDVERGDAASFAAFDAVGTHRLERPRNARERTITWVRKESLLKATGHGLAVDPAGIRITDPTSVPAVLTWDAPDAPVGPMWVRDVEIGRDHAAAVTVLAEQEPQLVVRKADPGAARPTASR